MQDKKPQKQMSASQYANSMIIDMKSLSNILKPIAKNLYENNNRILNQLLSSKDQQLLHMVAKVLTHTLQIAHYKVLISQVLSLMNKSIICIKTVHHSASSAVKQSIQNIINSMIDILTVISTQHRQTQQTSLRILQTTFSLIDSTLVPSFNITIITKIHSICFEFCSVPSIMSNISVSALCALVEATFQLGKLYESFQLLEAFLRYLFEGRKYIWIKGKEIRGLIWDLVVVGVRNFTANHIIACQHHKQCVQLLQKMYQISTQYIFLKKNKNLYTSPPPEPHPPKSPKPDTFNIGDFIRYFKVYVNFSSSLSIESHRVSDKQLVPFRATIPKLVLVCNLQRNPRMFIFMEAICLLLLDQYDMPLAVDKGSVFMDVLSKVAEELCWGNEAGVRVNWEHNENYIDKVINEEPRVSDGDFVRLLKNTVVQLRMKFQKDQDLLNCKKLKKQQMQSQRSNKQLTNLPQSLNNSKKWQQFLKNIIRIIRYLSSLNYIPDQTEQDPTRKIILQLQYWYLLCPAPKAKNMVLQQLLITANVLNNRMQAIKVSQSVQIASNILYGYYDELDSMGLTIILKMMAGIRADWEDGKSFEELDQIYGLCGSLFVDEKLIRSQQAFLVTIQALVQCISSLVADIQQPKQKPSTSLPATKRYHKMIEFLLQRLIIVVKHNLPYAAAEWNFITSFLITLCINKNPKTKEQGVRTIGVLVSSLLKAELGEELDLKKEGDVLGLYEELAKSRIMVREVQVMLIQQLKMILPRIKQQKALTDGFRIVRIISEMQFQGQPTPISSIQKQPHPLTKSQLLPQPQPTQPTPPKPKNPQLIFNTNQLQQTLIKQCLHRITDPKNLKQILQGMQTKVSQKNEQYRLINLLWTVADYLRRITPRSDVPGQYLELWEILFRSVWVICESTGECETRQAAIHSLTQILAEVLGLLPFDFVIVIISKYYHQMVLLLLGIHVDEVANNQHHNTSAILNEQKSPQTAKIALKNFIKLYKKLISIQPKPPQTKQQIINNLSDINQHITKFLRNHTENKNTGHLTLQFLYQLLNYILLVSDDKGFEGYGIGRHLREIFVAIRDVIRVAEGAAGTGGSGGTKLDLKSHMFRKKVQPAIEKISQMLVLEGKQGEVKQEGNVEGSANDGVQIGKQKQQEVSSQNTNTNSNQRKVQSNEISTNKSESA